MESITFVVRCSSVTDHRTNTGKPAMYTLHHTNISTKVTPATTAHTESSLVFNSMCATSSVTITTETQQGLQSLSDMQDSRKQSLNRPDTCDSAVGQPALVCTYYTRCTPCTQLDSLSLLQYHSVALFHVAVACILKGRKSRGLFP